MKDILTAPWFNLRRIPMGFAAPTPAGKHLLLTGTGKYFKNMEYEPAVNLGLIRLTDGGRTAELIRSFADGGCFISEFPAHMVSHVARHAVDPANRVVIHGYLCL